MAHPPLPRGTELCGASLAIAIDSSPDRLEVARRFGANVTLNAEAGDLIPQIKRWTDVAWMLRSKPSGSVTMC